jgi:hypothetical protein
MSCRRKTAEGGIQRRPVDLLPFDQFWQVEHEEVRKHLRHRLAGMCVGGQRDDLDVRVPRGETHEIGARIAGRAEHSDPDFFHRLAPANFGCAV